MNTQQLTFGEAIGMPRTVPTGPHREDMIETMDGETVRRADAHISPLGDAFACEYNMAYAYLDNAIETTRECLVGIEDYVTDYVQSDDYGDQYAYLLSECAHDVTRRVTEHCKEYDIACPSCILDDVVNDLIDGVECTYGHGYLVPSGVDCCLFSFPIGEHEEQIDITCHDVLDKYHTAGVLTEILDTLDRDFCLSGCDKIGKYPCFEMYSDFGGDAWYYHVSDDVIQTAIVDNIIAYCQRN